MAKIIMELNGKEYVSRNDWASLDEFFDACPIDDEFPDYDADGSEGGTCNYRLNEE